MLRKSESEPSFSFVIQKKNKIIVSLQCNTWFYFIVIVGVSEKISWSWIFFNERYHCDTFLLHNWILTGKTVHVSIIIGPSVCLNVKNDIHALSGQQLALIWCVTLYYRKQGLGKPQEYNVFLSLFRFFQKLLFKTNCRGFFALSKLLRPFQMRNPNFLFLSGSFVSYVGAKITHTKPLFTTQTNWNTCCEVTLQQNLSFSATPCNFRIATLSTEKWG